MSIQYTVPEFELTTQGNSFHLNFVQAAIKGNFYFYEIHIGDV